MKRRTWISTALAGPLAAAAAAQQPPQSQAPAKDEFAPIETTPSLEANAEAAAPRWLSKNDFAALTALANAIVPSTGGKPGALDAGVPAFLDFLLSQSPAPRQQLYRDGLARLRHLDLATALQPLNDPWTYQPPADPFVRFLREAKDDIIAATFSSREWIAASGRRGGSGTYYLSMD